MSDFVDIHSHLLPGIADGPDDVARSLSMARAAVAAGTAVLAATPHLRVDFPDVKVAQIAAGCADLQSEQLRTSAQEEGMLARGCAGAPDVAGRAELSGTANTAQGWLENKDEKIQKRFT